MVANTPRCRSLATTSLAGRLHFSASSLTETPSESITMPISSLMYSVAICWARLRGCRSLSSSSSAMRSARTRLSSFFLPVKWPPRPGPFWALGSGAVLVGSEGPRPAHAGAARAGRPGPPGPPGRGRDRRDGAPGPPGRLGRCRDRRDGWDRQGRRDVRRVRDGPGAGPGLGQLDVAGRLGGPGGGRRGVGHLDPGEARIRPQLGDGGRNERARAAGWAGCGSCLIAPLPVLAAMGRQGLFRLGLPGTLDLGLLAGALDDRAGARFGAALGWACWGSWM